jgi:hypothetical protein
VHVVANGLTTLRSREAEGVLVSSGIDTIPKLQTQQRKAEIKDLDETCRILRQAIRKHKKPL